MVVAHGDVSARRQDLLERDVTAVLDLALQRSSEPTAPRVRRTTVAVLASDPVTGAGVCSQLRFRPELEVLGTAAATADVVVVVADEVDDDRVRSIRAATRRGSRTVLVASTLTGTALLAAVDAGATAVLRRVDATADGLAAAVRGAALGEGVMPPDLLGKLMARVGTVGVASHDDPTGSTRTFGGLTQRELKVLRLLADGCTTGEIARELCYSERTIKNAIQALTARLHLRNRSHAVAYAVRHGLI
jgi:DNA-binding NarL/FixJ family response regulator